VLRPKVVPSDCVNHGTHNGGAAVVGDAIGLHQVGGGVAEGQHQLPGTLVLHDSVNLKAAHIRERLGTAGVKTVEHEAIGLAAF
jgi:hypothetical protein